tara:strand:+ start:1839 stop:2195 length:357 start_codon:yes stop_codon:yes gene_type:complete
MGETTIFLRDLIRDVDIGIHDHEIGNPQSLRFDLEVSISGSEPPMQDDINHVLDYEYLLESLENAIGEGRFSLLESLGSRILENLMTPPQVTTARVQIIKLDILEETGTLGCQMTRVR